jgi:hypothetical protein
MKTNLDLVDDFQERCGKVVGFKKADEFMLAYLRQVIAPLPDIAARGLALAIRFQNGLLPPGRITEARVECWKYLKEHRATYDFQTPEYCAVRAVICVLHEDRNPGEDDVADTVDFFLRMADRFEDHSSSAPSLLGRYFSLQE